MQVEIYIVKSELFGNKAIYENSVRLEAIKAEISTKCEGISILPEFKGEWWENGKKYVDIVEIWRILATMEKPIEFKWLNAKIEEIKACTSQRSQLMTANIKTSPYFF